MNLAEAAATDKTVSINATISATTHSVAQRHWLPATTDSVAGQPLAPIVFFDSQPSLRTTRQRFCVKWGQGGTKVCKRLCATRKNRHKHQVGSLYIDTYVK